MGRNPHIRPSERAEILGAIALADTGSASVVIVDGEPGIGKTYLLDEASASAAAGGATVLRSELTEVETVLSWAGLSVLLADLDERVLDELPEPRRHALDRARGIRSTGPVEADQVASALAELLPILARDQTVVIVLDDLHWLDRASAAAITYAVRLNTRQRIAVLAAHRLDTAVPVDFGRIRSVDVRRITLSGLSAAGLHHVLVERECSVSRRSDLIRIHELSGGNPVYAVELARQLAEQHPVPSPDGSHALDEAAFGRLHGLDHRTIETAQVCALVARPTVQTVQAVVGTDALQCLEELERRKVISLHGGAIEFTHPLRRAAVVRGVGELERRALHRLISDALNDPEQAVLHAAEAAHDVDAHLAEAMERAGDSAAELGVPDLAARRYRRAAELTPRDDTQASWRRRHRSVRTAVAVGDHDDVVEEAEAVYREAVTPQDVADALIDLVDVRSATRGIDAAVEALRDGLGRLEGSPDCRAAVYERLVRLEHHRGMAGAREAARAVLVNARASGDDQLVRRAEIIDACSAVLVGEPVDVEVLALPEGLPLDSGIDSAVFLSEILVWTNHLERAEAMLRSMESHARRQGTSTSLARTLLTLADAYLRWGRWDDAEHCLLEATELVEPIGIAVGDLADLAWLNAARGNQADARSYVGANTRRLRHDFLTDHIQHSARAGFVALCEGAWAEAVEFLVRADEQARALGFFDLAGLPFRHDLVESLVNAGEVADANRVATEMAADARRAQVAGGEALALRSQALVANATGRVEEAAELVTAALIAHGVTVLVFERARTELLAGSVLRRAGRRTVAREHLESAHATFEELGAAPFASRAEAELGRLGSRRVDSGLTASEQRVAGLVASGRTNAEVAVELYVSLRTVESNLTRVYRKLGVRSRTELAARMRPDP